MTGKSDKSGSVSSAGAPRSDRVGAVRAGEEFDVAALDAWLKARVPSLSGMPRVTQFSGGASNWTYRLEYDRDDLVLRRPPAGTKAKSAHDMSREYRVQNALRPVFSYVPEMIAHCDDASVIGSEFYVMRRIDGLIPRASLGFDLDPARTRALCERVVDTLVELHSINPAAVGLDAMDRGPGYVRRQVEGWSDRYRRARTWNVPKFESIMSWLAKNAPDDGPHRVIHNDFRFDNVVLDRTDPTRVIGVLDWEMATIGDGLMDLGNSMAYWVQADDDPIGRALRRQPTHLPGMMTRREVVDRYCERMGIRPDNWTFYEVCGAFRLAVIIQQIYYRYHHRQTRNPAFRRFWLVAHYLHWRCRTAIRGSGIA